MRVDFRDGLFTVKCKPDDHDFVRGAGFRWHSELNMFATDDPRIALGCEKYLGRSARDVIAPVELAVPEGESYLPFQEEGIRFALQRKNVLIADEPGLGKGHPLSTLVATPTGFKPIGDLSLGDQVIGSDGAPVAVTGIFDRGLLPVYRVETHDAGVVTVDGDHLWTIFDEASGEWETITTVQLAARVDRGEQPIIPTLTGPVQFAAKAFQIDPLTAGIDRGNRNAYSEIMKFDCRDYARSALSQRMAFLSGVIRTLGRVRNGRIRIDVKAGQYNFDLVDAIIDITRSLGGIAMREKIGSKVRLRLTLSEDMWLPLVGYSKRGKRMNRRWQGIDIEMPERRIVSVRPHGSDQVRCISVAAHDQLYVTEDYIVTHNTVQAIGVSNQLPGIGSVLIICLASLKEHWRRAIEKWDVHGLSVAVADTHVFPDTQVVVINFDILEQWSDAIRAGTWDVLIVDEAHYLQNKEARRTREVLGGLKKVPMFASKPNGRKKKVKVKRILAHRTVFLTGTPMGNRPINMWPLVEACDPDGIGRDKEQFQYRYCGGYETGFGIDDKGASNLEEFHEGLKAFMIRRLKEDVLKDLPPKIRQVIPISSEGLQQKMLAERDAVMDLLRQYESQMGIREDASEEEIAELVMSATPTMFADYAEAIDGDPAADTPLNRLAIARAELALTKIPMVVEHIENLLLEEQKVVLFAYHRDVIKGLRDALKKHKPAVVFGDTPQVAKRDYRKCRQGQVDWFQEDPDCRVMIGQFTAAGTGYTMTAARTVVCAEMTWVPHELTQAEDRVHRIGQLDVVHAQHLVVAGSLDDALISRVFAKQQIIDQALDGRIRVSSNSSPAFA